MVVVEYQIAGRAVNKAKAAPMNAKASYYSHAPKLQLQGCRLPSTEAVTKAARAAADVIVDAVADDKPHAAVLECTVRAGGRQLERDRCACRRGCR